MILMVLNMSGFMAWKPSYGNVEVARFFVYSFPGLVHSCSFLRVIWHIIPHWKGLGEGNPTVSRVKEPDQYW